MVGPDIYICTTDMREAASLLISSIINKSGLSTDYTIGSTNLSGYSATHSSFSPNYWRSANGNPTGTVIFDLGSGDRGEQPAASREAEKQVWK